MKSYILKSGFSELNSGATDFSEANSGTAGFWEANSRRPDSPELNSQKLNFRESGSRNPKFSQTAPSEADFDKAYRQKPALGLPALFGVELLKIRRSKIFWILLIPAVMMWLPSALNADINFIMGEYDVAPEYNFFIQGYMGMAWFMIPATLIICCVLLHQTELSHRGLVKSLSLPVSSVKLCLAKFLVTVLLTVVQLVLSVAAYYGAAMLASRLYKYDFVLPFSYVCRTAALIYLAALPMAAVFWMLSVLIRTPIFSAGLGLASIVPSVLMLNTKFWCWYPFDYSFYMLMTEYGRIAPEIYDSHIQLIPMLPVGIGIAIVSLALACLRYGAAERRD